MSRVKRGVTSRAKHKKLLHMTKGYRMTKSRLVRVAKQAALHSGEYAHTGRKLKKRDMRSVWITRINQSVQQMDLSYNQFINALKRSNIPLDRKMLSDLALRDPEVFKIVVDKVRQSIN